jgi:septal ring factor EnvC (AmiA/AmiB activator)
VNEPPRGDPPRGERLLAEDEIPASVGQLKTLRRWLIVTAVWAVAATALGVFALVEANQQEEANQERAAGELGRVQRQLNDRIADLEKRVDGLPTSEDVQDLDSRLGRVEDDAGATADSLEKLTDRVDGIERDLNDLEEAVASGTETETTETTP